ncbi:hypothetical protein NHX12_015275 [Muraenolepis orangiensis]|uniref:Uncharacterized protein n=1 Tax=Muraenolepis orangiensis TaxID=630683 RepID=A0A9Q0DD21_9TELE|nr:hypothetical protein NHX12_015275 [Muraenolepis orangiensis]
MLRRTTWSAVEQGSQPGHGHLAAYLRKWRLQLSTGKMCRPHTTCATERPKGNCPVSVDKKRLEHQLAPKYLGVRLDRDTVLQTAP